jgi:hypothetical protein
MDEKMKNRQWLNAKLGISLRGKGEEEGNCGLSHYIEEAKMKNNRGRKPPPSPHHFKGAG